MQHKKWFKTATSVIVFSLLSGAAAAVLPSSVSADAANRFSDVPAGHWAEKHIAKLSLQGIVKGNNGKFMPSDNITQQEAITMAIRFIGKDSDVKEDSAVVFTDAFKVDNYFKPYVALALKLKLIDENEEFKLAEQDPSTSWGERKASREWITKLMIKAIGQQSLADSLVTSPVSFSDSGKVDAGYAGYINAAVSLKLVNGVTPEQFDPQGLITRAAMATMFSRAENQYPVEYAGEATGVLSGKDGSTVTVYEENGEETFQLASDTYVYRFDSDKATTIDKLDPNTKVEVISDGTHALYVEQLDAEQQVKKITGVFDHINPSENKMWLWVDNDAVSVYYDSKLVVKDASGAAAAVASLTKDSKIEVLQDTYRDKPLAVSVTVQSAPVNKTGQGKVQAVNTTDGAITVADGTSGTSETLSVSPQADIIWQGSLLTGGIAQIRVGDTISYEVKDSVVTRITVDQTSSKTVTGQLISASADSKTVTYVKDGGVTPDAKFLADAVSVQIEGLSGTGIADLVDIVADQLNTPAARGFLIRRYVPLSHGRVESRAAVA